MYNVSEAYKTAANSNSRNVVIRAEFRTKTFIESEGKYRWQFRENQYSYGNLLSVKIVEGQTTGAFRLGDTICPVLDISVARGCTVYNDDMIDVYVSFDNGKEWQKLTGDFFVDTVDRDRQSIKIRAYGFMLQLSKSYNSKLTFPATEDDVLREMLAINTVDVGYELLTNANIAEKPVKGEAEDGSTLYYTRREMYGYLAAANGGNAYINNANQLCFSTPRETGETFTHEQAISETLTPPQTVEHIQWNTSGLSYSLGDDYAENSLEFYNPIVFSANEQILHFLEQALIGFTLDGAVVKKNGCGYYELGDITTYIDIVGTQHKMLIMGIVYDFSGGYFSETLYSLTNTESQRTYAGQQVVSNQIGGGQAQQPIIGGTLAEYEYISDVSVKCNGITYTAKKDETTGLVTLITSDQGGVFSPIITQSISDVSFHNAILMAVAIVKGIPSLPQPDAAYMFNNSLDNSGTDTSGRYTLEYNEYAMSYAEGITDMAMDMSNGVGGANLTILDNTAALETEDFTFCFWFKTSGGGNISGYDYVCLLYQSANNGIVIRNTNLVLLCGGNEVVISDAVCDDEWHYCCYARNNHTMYASVDGKTSVSTTIQDGLNSYVKFGIGQRSFAGYIDSVRLYNKYLSPAEVMAVMALK